MILLQNGRLLDPAGGLDAAADLLMVEGRIERIGPGLPVPDGATVVDASDLLVAPGLIDLHVHFREPGEEYKEDVASGAAAAAAGGFTTVCCMPNTKPTNDCRAVSDLIVSRAAAACGVRVHPIGAITKGLAGRELADIGELKEAGCVAISDDGMPVMNSLVMRRALEYARSFDLPVIQHAEDTDLSQHAPMNEGEASTRCGLRGQPAAAEEIIVRRDLALVALTGARYHVAHASTAGTIRAVAEAKERGLPVTCEVTPHHLHLTDVACCGYDTSTKVNPPLRTGADLEILRRALADGTIDAIATDHAPHSSIEKDVEYDHAAFGINGLETALALVLDLVDAGALSLETAIRRLTSGPAAVLGLPGGRLVEGGPADVTVVDLTRQWVCDPERFRSKSRNTPFAGRKMKGKAVLTIVGGKVVHDELGVG